MSSTNPAVISPAFQNVGGLLWDYFEDLVHLIKKEVFFFDFTSSPQASRWTLKSWITSAVAEVDVILYRCRQGDGLVPERRAEVGLL